MQVEGIAGKACQGERALQQHRDEIRGETEGADGPESFREEHRRRAESEEEQSQTDCILIFYTYALCNKVDCL